MAFLPREYLEEMKIQHGLRMTQIDEVNFLFAVKLVSDAGTRRKPLDPLALHGAMFCGHNYAGQYRPGCVFDSRTGKVKYFPVARFVPDLMFSFRDAYKKALRPNPHMNERQIALQASMVGSQIRCLHPFVMGNAEISYLFVNHILQVHGLPWTVEMMPPHVFKAVRTLYRVHNSEYYI